MELKEAKYNLDMICIIGMSISDTLCSALRRFYDSIKYYDLNSGDSIFHHYKELEGKFFKDEGMFILYNKSKNNVDLTNIAVSNNELREFEKLCKEYGVDILYQKRPENLEDLFQRYVAGEQLSSNQENIINAFTLKDMNGNLYLKNDASLICFNLKDLVIIERVLDKLELNTLNIERRKQRAKNMMDKLKKVQEKTKETVKAKDKSVNQQLKDLYSRK